VATRFYLSSTAASPVTPGYAAWTRTADGSRLTMSPTKDSSAFTSSTCWANSAVTAGTFALAEQFISDPMAAGIVFTTANTFSSVVRVMESAANDNVDRLYICIKVVSQDGNTLRATLKPLSFYGPTTTEWATALTTKDAGNAVALTTGYTTVAGDRLVVEFGAGCSTAGTSVTASLNFGSASATDLAITEGVTTANNPWFEVSTNITFIRSDSFTGTGGVTSAGTAAVSKNSTPAIDIHTNSYPYAKFSGTPGAAPNGTTIQGAILRANDGSLPTGVQYIEFSTNIANFPAFSLFTNPYRYAGVAETVSVYVRVPTGATANTLMVHYSDTDTEMTLALATTLNAQPKDVWVRYEATDTPTVTGTNFFQVYMNSSTLGELIQVAMPQTDFNPYATPWILTDGSAVSENSYVKTGGTAPFSSVLGGGALNLSYTGTGGVTSGDTAPFNVAVVATPNGGVSAAGAALRTVSQAIQTAGGAALASAAIVALALATAPSGGLVSGSSAPFSMALLGSPTGGVATGGTSLEGVSLTATGGVATGGLGLATKDVIAIPSGGTTTGNSAIEGMNLVPTPSGGVTTSGSGQGTMALVAAPAGGVSSGGSASYSSSGAVQNITANPSGGVATGGTSLANVVYTYAVVGGISTGSSATIAVAQTIYPSGGVSSSGMAVHSPAVLGLGGLSSSGSSVSNMALRGTPTGGVASGGSAGYSSSAAQNLTATPSGGVSSGGTGSATFSLNVYPSGGISSGGVAAFGILRTSVPTGGVITGGVAGRLVVYVLASAGGIQSSGAASTYGTFLFTSYGGVITGGGAVIGSSVTLITNPKYLAIVVPRTYTGIAAVKVYAAQAVKRNFSASNTKNVSVVVIARFFTGVLQ